MIAELVLAVQAFFDAYGVKANVVGEFPERDKQVNQVAAGAGRVVIVYGDENGDCGELAPRHGDNEDDQPRRLASDLVKLTLYVWGSDAKDKSRGAQVDAARALRDWTIRAFQSSSVSTGDLQWGGTRRTKDVERQFGVELVVDLVIRTHVDDVPDTIVTPTGEVTPVTPTDTITRGEE